MLRIIIASIIFAIAGDACAKDFVPRTKISNRGLNVIRGHKAVKILRPTRTFRPRPQNND